MSFKFDFAAFTTAADRLGLVEREVPFALANAMTRAAYTTKDALVRDTWPKHVQVKSNNFLRAALDVEPAMARDFRAGRGMRAEIFDALGHVDLKRLTLGGTKKPTRGAGLAIPTRNVRRTGTGAVVKSQKPRSLSRTIRKGDLIFQATGRGKNAKLKLMYAVRTTAKIKAQVPFYSDFSRLYRAEVYKAYPNAVRNVIKRNRIAGK